MINAADAKKLTEEAKVKFQEKVSKTELQEIEEKIKKTANNTYSFLVVDKHVSQLTKDTLINLGYTVEYSTDTEGDYITKISW